jgi:hypothetical protein
MTEYGRRIDCAKNGCETPHADDGDVMPIPQSWMTGEDGDWQTKSWVGVVNNHAVTLVKRTIIYSNWEET